MSDAYEFEATVRAEVGTTAARVLRRQNKFPAVLYGAGQEPLLLALEQDTVKKKLENDGIYSHILSIKVGDKAEKAVLKDIQRHPSKTIILHMDLQRVSLTEKIRVHIPLHFLGENNSLGVKKGGIVMHNLVDIEVSCLPDDLPEYIEVDLSAVDLGGSIHLSDLNVPEGVEIAALAHGADHDSTVAAIQLSRTVSDEDEESPEEIDESPEEDDENQ